MSALQTLALQGTRRLAEALNLYGVKGGTQYQGEADSDNPATLPRCRLIRNLQRDLNAEVHGEGHFSVVVTLPGYDRLAFKLILGADTSVGYLAWCRSMRREGKTWAVHLPDVLAMTQIRDAWIVALPLYKDAGNHPEFEELAEFLSWFADEDIEALKISRAYQWARGVQKFPPTLINALEEICCAFCCVGHFDLHSANWMVDADGNVVITDPLSFKL